MSNSKSDAYSIYQGWLPKVIDIAKNAGEVIEEVYVKKSFTVESKLDNSPITEADIQANKIIIEGLQKIDPHIPILSEESVIPNFEERQQWSRYWLVDPLDGTREFIRGTDEFTVNIAFIENHQPVMGIIVAPVLHQSYWAVKGQGAFFQLGSDKPQVMHTQARVRSPIKLIVSRRHESHHEEAWKVVLDKLGPYELIYCGSSLKICLVAKGEADIYPRLGPIGEWDTAAGQCILEEAGGKLIDLSGNPLQYNCRNTLINEGFYAIGSQNLISIF